MKIIGKRNTKSITSWGVVNSTSLYPSFELSLRRRGIFGHKRIFLSSFREVEQNSFSNILK